MGLSGGASVSATIVAAVPVGVADMVVVGVGVTYARVPRIVVIVHGIVWVAMVVGMVVVVRVHVIVPTMAMDVVVVGAYICMVVVGTVVVVIGGDVPVEVGGYCVATETEIVGCAIQMAGVLVVEPDALQVDGHVDLFACVCVVGIKPDLIVLRVDSFGPYFVYESIGLDFVFVATIDHNLTLSVEIVDCTCCLCVGEIANR